MASAQVIVNTVKEIPNSQELNRYDESVCADIQKRLDSKLREKDLSIAEKALFVIDKFAIEKLNNLT